MSVRERYVLICGNLRPADDPRGSCAATCPHLHERFKARLAERKLKARFRALKTSCMDFCATGPTVCVMPDNVWYAGVKEADIDELIDSHLLAGRPVDRLLRKP